MPTYTYQCSNPHCQQIEDQRRPVLGRNIARVCDVCNWGLLKRVFTPTVNLIVPGHFMLDKDWAMPEKGDPAWENMSPAGARGGIHTQRTPSLKDEFDKVKQWG